MVLASKDSKTLIALKLGQDIDTLIANMAIEMPLIFITPVAFDAREWPVVFHCYNLREIAPGGKFPWFGLVKCVVGVNWRNYQP